MRLLKTLNKKKIREVALTILYISIVAAIASFIFAGQLRSAKSLEEMNAGEALNREIQLQAEKQKALDLIEHLDEEILKTREYRNQKHKQEVCKGSGCYLGAILPELPKLGVQADYQEPRKIFHKGFSPESPVQDYINYAYEISNGDLDFLGTLESENGQRNPHRQSDVPDPNGPNGREDSRGFCQMHRARQSHLVDDERFRHDRRRQLDKCWELYKGGTTMFGKRRKNKHGQLVRLAVRENWDIRE